MRNYILKISVLAFLMTLTACKKDWLEKKRDIALVVPGNLSDLRLLINNTLVLSVDNMGIGEMAAGDFQLTTSSWNAAGILPEKNAYVWINPFVNQTSVVEWDGAYKQIEICNVVLEGLEKIPVTTYNNGEWNDIKANALFYRGKAYYNLAQIFAPPYSSANLTNPGIILKKSQDINEPLSRASLKDSYSAILEDLLLATSLVSGSPPFKTQASKAAIYGELTRCYLTMGDYANTIKYADSSLKYHSSLLDYNTIDSTAFFPFAMFNDEVAFHSSLGGNYGSFYAPKGIIDPVIIQSYAPDDLRKPIYFKKNANGTYNMRAFYFGIRQTFSGIATDEILLCKSEALARTGRTVEATAILNTLLSQRFKTGKYQPYEELDPKSALKVILMERRKELLLRGVRWTDLRRLNQDPETAVTIIKEVDGQVYTLKPSDSKYTFPLPDYVIRDYKVEQNSGW